MLEAPLLLVRAALPGMYAGGWGRVVNVSSVHGLRASALTAAYVAARHGLEGLSKVTAPEGGPHGVTSNCLDPGHVRTPLVEKQVADRARVHDIPESEVVEKVMLTESAVKRLVEPDEVASLVAWMCSDSAGMVTGASCTRDGGRTGTALATALTRMRHPARLLTAPRGLLDETPGLHQACRLDAMLETLPLITGREVVDVDHYTISMGERGAGGRRRRPGGGGGGRLCLRLSATRGPGLIPAPWAARLGCGP